jgi:hypothetical protein
MDCSLLWLEEFAGLDEAHKKLSVWNESYTTNTCIQPWTIKVHRNMSGITRKKT